MCETLKLYRFLPGLFLPQRLGKPGVLKSTHVSVFVPWCGTSHKIGVPSVRNTLSQRLKNF